jgi:hypothetical protein
VLRRLTRPHLMAVLLLLLPGLTAAGAPALEDLLPADADMVLLVDDVPGLLQDWPNLPLARAWNDPAVQDMLQKYAGEGELPELPVWLQNPGEAPEAETDPHARLVRALTGQLAIVVDMDRFSTSEDHDSGHQLPQGIVILAQVDGNEDTIVELLTPPEEAVDVESNDTTPQLFQLPEGSWQIQNGILVVTSTRDETAAQLALLSGATEALTLSASDGFQAMRRHSTAGGFEMLFNLEVLAARLMAEMASGEEPMADNPLGVTPQALFDGLALDVFRAGWLTVHPAPDATEMTYGMTYSEERGLVRLLAFQPLPGDRRLPLPDDAADATAFAYDLPAAWEAATEIATQISPALGVAMEAQIAQMSAQVGIDLVKEIPGAFAGEFATATFMDETAMAVPVSSPEDYPEMMSQVWVATLRQGHRMGEALDALMPMLAATGVTPTTRTVGGKVLNVIAISGMDSFDEDPVQEESSEDDAPVFAWSVGDEYLVAVQGDTADLIRVMNGLEQDGPGIWGTSKVKSVVNSLPEGAAVIQYQDSSRLLGGLISTMLMGAGMGAAGDDEAGAVSAEQQQQLADAVGRLITQSAAAMYKSSGELVGRGRVLHGTP